ncbi:uncharacterized protein LOC121368074 [Gigantopelta aegis]|uniref:uncharacterized protein LOC121368074 n=1 Tax=Gigantopelta aegis TaxID=1735272 RepID=UPI001B88D894|nr:uncharacterized protein LOC121368074 [Gigantopelta aegis]
MTVTQCKCRRPWVDDEEKQRSRGSSVKCSVLKEDKSEVPVCQPTFLSIFGIKKDRVQNIAKYWLQTGQARPENRGGARNREKHNLKKERIRTHISTFTCRASHYAHCGAPGRKYLPSDLSVAKMHKMFIDQNHKQVSYALYWSMFVYDFNLAFGHPAKDICSTCVKFRMQIKNPELSEEEKREQITLFMFHRRRARSFYNIMNDVGNSLTMYFDIMENLVLPKSLIGQTYYSRQLYLYVFGVVRHHGRGEAQGTEDIDLFVWMEHQNNLPPLPEATHALFSHN